LTVIDCFQNSRSQLTIINFSFFSFTIETITSKFDQPLVPNLTPLLFSKSEERFPFRSGVDWSKIWNKWCSRFPVFNFRLWSQCQGKKV